MLVFQNQGSSVPCGPSGNNGNIYQRADRAEYLDHNVVAGDVQHR